MSLKRKNIRSRENQRLEQLERDPATMWAAIAAVKAGLAAHEAGDIDGALVQYRRALAHNPRFAEAHHALGVGLRDAGDWDGALDAHRMAINLQPQHVAAHYYYGDLLGTQGHYAEAAKWLSRCIDIDAEYVEAYNRLGQVLFEQFLFPQAIRAYQAGLERDPKHGGMHHNLALAQIMLGDKTGAAAALEQAVLYQPESMNTLSYLISNKMYLCDWKDIETLSLQVVDAVVEKRAIVDPFTFQGLPVGPGNAEQFAAACGCARVGAASKGMTRAKTEQVFQYQQRADERIRVGYVSMDFRSHPMAYLMTEILQKHDRQKFEIFAYSFGPPDNGPERRRFIESVDHFVDIQNLTDEQAAARIHADGIGILIDRKGYTFGHRLGIFERRPAPVAVNYLAFGGTMGVDYIDYAVVDDFVVPKDQQQFYSERLVYLPDSYQPNSFRPVSDATPSRAECGLPRDGFVFCCFNQTYKITPKTFDLWMRILQRAPGSVLWLLKPDQATADNLCREAQARGVDPRRLAFAPKAPQAEHLARHRHADLFLDTLVVNALTTTSDALFMDCPVITCPGATFVARGAGSILRGLEMPELITENLSAYEELAVQIASDPSRLQRLKQKIASKRRTAPLFDSSRYARHLDAAYAGMWRQYQSGEGPTPFAVAPIDTE